MTRSGLWFGVALIVVLGTRVWAQDASVVAYKPQYLAPSELARIVGIRESGGREMLEWRAAGALRSVDIRRNDGANLIMIIGEPADVAAAEALLKAADVAPRQIMVEAKIVEIDRDRLNELGFDWAQISAHLAGRFDYRRDYEKYTVEYPGGDFSNRRTVTDRRSLFDAGADVFTNFQALERAGAATVRDAPRILTLNNRRATILDGQRVTYITRYSSFTNLFETDTLDAGLTLSVVPSLGETGYLTLDVRAELTSLRGDISGSPVKDGQIVENTVIVKDGESVLLGGFQRSVETRTRRGFPLLGRLIPFLFSREVKGMNTRENFVAITAHAVDLAPPMDDATRDLLKGGPPPEKK